MMKSAATPVKTKAARGKLISERSDRMNKGKRMKRINDGRRKTT